MITLSDGINTIPLPYDLFWEDENWAAVEQTATRSVTGKLILQSMPRVAGRPITLGPPPVGGGGWMRRALLPQIRTWLNTPGQALTLVIRGSSFPVQFRHHDGDPYSDEPVRWFSDANDTDWVIPTFRFITTEAAS
ncbi:MAG: hypothetical protein ACNA7T_05120 [Haliea sp.]